MYQTPLIQKDAFRLSTPESRSAMRGHLHQRPDAGRLIVTDRELLRHFSPVTLFLYGSAELEVGGERLDVFAALHLLDAAAYPLVVDGVALARDDLRAAVHEMTGPPPMLYEDLPFRIRVRARDRAEGRFVGEEPLIDAELGYEGV
jgi:hypothetical protein